MPPTYAITAAEKAITATLETMRRAAKEEDDTGLPATWTGEVIETQRRSRYISVVRLVSETPPPFAPGQYLPVTCSLMSRQWRYLSPALPPNKEGHLEFHIKPRTQTATHAFWPTPAPATSGPSAPRSEKCTSAAHATF